jgi:hypothetical protein
LDFAPVRALQKSDRGFDAVGADRDPACACRDCRNETPFGWIGFN